MALFSVDCGASTPGTRLLQTPYDLPRYYDRKGRAAVFVYVCVYFHGFDTVAHWEVREGYTFAG